jgi:hypothetical protein
MDHVIMPNQFLLAAKRELRIDLEIPSDYRYEAVNCSLFMQQLARRDSELFFALVDYLFAKSVGVGFSEASIFMTILDEANHKYTVYEVDGRHQLCERLPKEHAHMIRSLLDHKVVYKSEFTDAFSKIYGRDPNFTDGTGEAFQALESALKFHLGEDKGQNLGALLGWLEHNPTGWDYKCPSAGQTNAEAHFIANVDFVNRAFRAVKHGQVSEKLTVPKLQAEAVLRAVSLSIFELENCIKLI